MAIVSKVLNEKSSKSDLYCKPSNQARKSVSQLQQSNSKTGTKVLAKKKTKCVLPREVTQLLQDGGAERIMQEMEGKLTSRKRTPTKIYSFGDTGDTERLFHDKDEKVQKKMKRPRTKSLTARTADSFQFGRNSPQNVQVVKVSRFFLLIYLLYLRSDSQTVISYVGQQT